MVCVISIGYTIQVLLLCIFILIFVGFCWKFIGVGVFVLFLYTIGVWSKNKIQYFRNFQELFTLKRHRRFTDTAASLRMKRRDAVAAINPHEQIYVKQPKNDATASTPKITITRVSNVGNKYCWDFFAERAFKSTWTRTRKWLFDSCGIWFFDSLATLENVWNKNKKLHPKNTWLYHWIAFVLLAEERIRGSFLCCVI